MTGCRASHLIVSLNKDGLGTSGNIPEKYPPWSVGNNASPKQIITKI